MGWWNKITNSWWKIYLFLLLIGVIIYANSWGNELFWDDLDNFVNNRYVHSWEYFGNYFSENLIAGSNLASNYWRPMMLLVWSLCWSFWQDWGGGYRIVSLLLHIGCATLIFQIWNKLFNKRWLAAVVSLLFVVHPLQTEAISYASGISDPLSGVFILGSLYSYLRFRLDGWRWGWWLALGLMIGGLMSRETVVMMPAVIGMVELWLFLDQRVEKSWKHWFGKVWWLVGGFGLVSGIYLWLRGSVLNFGGTFNIYGEDTEFTRNPLYRVLTFWKVLTLFLGILLVPIGLHMDRLIDIERGLTNPLVLIGMGMMIVSIGVVIVGLRDFRRWRVVLFGLGWFWLWIFPISNLVIPVNGLMYEHWMYLPMIGFWTVVVYPVGIILEKYKLEKVGIGVLIVVLIYFGYLTIQRNQDWSKATTFYKQVLEYNPTSLRVWNNLGMTYADRGQLDEAIPIYEKAHQLDPENWVPIHNLGNVYAGKKDFDRAIGYYQQSLDKNPHSPSLNSLLNLTIEQKKYEQVKPILIGLVERNPADPNTILALIVAAIESNDKLTAEKYLGQLRSVVSASPILLDLENRIQKLDENLGNNPRI